MARVVLKGTPVSPGIAIGPLIVIRDAHLYEKRKIDEAEIESEIDALEHASLQVCSYLQKTVHGIPDNLAEYREIINAQIELASDSKMLENAKARIKRRKICASWALADTVEELCALFKGMGDPYLADRAQDIRLIGQTIADFLGGFSNAANQPKSGILAAHDISPADVLEMKLDGIQGMMTMEGGPTSHTAILARGLKVPAVVGIADLFKEIRTGERVIVDGLSGLVLLDPDETDLEFYHYRHKTYISFEKEALSGAFLPAITRDGFSISICANLENPSELPSLDKSGADGIGLYRTEFAWLGDKQPDEERLFKEYAEVIRHIGQTQVIFRTLDVGADKILTGRDALYEPNPALGLRGLRFCLRNRDIFKRQLKALLRAGALGNIAIMLPMVTAPWELEETVAIIRDCQTELKDAGLSHAAHVPLGAMIETPAAVTACDAVANICDFISIGTNDLLHYLMAIDRNNRHVAYLHEPLQPAFTRCLKRIIETGHEYNIPVSVCGELASDPFIVPLLLGMGIDKLSAAPRFVPGLKHMIRQLKASDCHELTRLALNEFDVLKTRSRLNEVLQASLGSDLAFHNTFIHNGNLP